MNNPATTEAAYGNASTDLSAASSSNGSG